MALAVLKTSSPLRVVVRPHPSHGRDDVQRLVPRELRELTSIYYSDDLPKLLGQADVVIGEYSTLLIEAAVYGAAVIAFEPDEVPLPISLAQQKVALRAASSDEISMLVSRKLREQKWDLPENESVAAATYLLGPLDGRATERLAELIAKISSNEP
ncbi:MAG: hypothetical protein IT353_07440 [Gemmatimonadaceae bacterium]|nr:hypothetical protein [Gemmatimonadaceae bacterium]